MFGLKKRNPKKYIHLRKFNFGAEVVIDVNEVLCVYQKVIGLYTIELKTGLSMGEFKVELDDLLAELGHPVTVINCEVRGDASSV